MNTGRAGRPLNTVPMQGHPMMYQSYQVLAPHETHWRPATCVEAECAAYTYGW
jgi:hypothetical protein